VSPPNPEPELVEVADGILRVTFPLPLGIDHVHCYLLRSGDGSWTAVDTGLGVPEAEERWVSVLGRVGGRVRRIVITHFHPDHAGAGAILARLTAAPVLQGALDYAQCVRAFGAERSPERLLAYLERHGLPPTEGDRFRAESDALAQWVALQPEPRPLAPGDQVDGWEVLHLPGHADGHLCLWREGVLIAGDALLASISPNVGLYPESRPDPLADYLGSLGRIAELAPAVAFAGHGPTIESPVDRARELVGHHEERLEQTLEALDAEPRTAYEVSLSLFPDALASVERRFALVEARAHLEHLVGQGRVRRDADGELTRYATG
jgi:glyoxylase-like metal-dependent hydrolase (beta-lactamase superfamily II)